MAKDTQVGIAGIILSCWLAVIEKNIRENKSEFGHNPIEIVVILTWKANTLY
jgi:hypothetical protein